MSLQSLDKDGNGSITVEELKEGFRKMGTMLEDSEVGCGPLGHFYCPITPFPTHSWTAWCAPSTRTTTGR